MGALEPRVVAVIASLPHELRSLRPLVKGRRGRVRGDGERRTRIANREVLFLQTGVGASRACDRIRQLVAQTEVECIVAVGFAGGLSPLLRSGDLVLGEEIVDLSSYCPEEDKPNRYSSDPGLLRLAREIEPQGFRVHSGRFACHSQLVCGPTDKRRLGAEWKALVVDMESTGVARGASEAGRPVLHARAVLDEVDFSMPPWIRDLVDDHGRPRLGTLFSRLVSSPGALAAVRGLWQRSRRSGGTLRWFVENFVEKLGGG